MREVVASLSLIPMGLERRTNQVHFIAHLCLEEIYTRDIACINEMLLWEQILLSQVVMNAGENALIADGSRSGFDMGNEVWSIFIAGLREMHFVPHPQRGPFLAIPREKAHRES